MVLARLNDVFQTLGPDNDSNSAPRGIGRLDDERTAEPREIAQTKLDVGLFVVW